MNVASRSRASKIVSSVADAVSVVKDGDIVMVGGFGGAGFPFVLRDALGVRALKDITIVCNNADFGLFVESGALKRIICSFPTGPSSGPVLQAIEEGRVELLLTPQGTMAEQIRAGGAGLGGVLTPTGLTTELGRELETIDYRGKRYVLAPALRGNVALVRASVADTYGNLVLRQASRNFNPLMAMAAETTIVEVGKIVEPGEIDPAHVHIPSAFVDILVETEGGSW
jgi:3-oxoadipate CoA-transferase, alpha subunit